MLLEISNSVYGGCKTVYMYFKSTLVSEWTRMSLFDLCFHWLYQKYLLTKNVTSFNSCIYIKVDKHDVVFINNFHSRH